MRFLDRPVVYLDAREAIEAADVWDSPIHSIRHVVRFGDGWAIFGHINCDECEHCEDQPVNWTKHAITIDCEQSYFRAFLERASETVASWPAWKRDCLANSLKSTRDTPRPPVAPEHGD